MKLNKLVFYCIVIISVIAIYTSVEINAQADYDLSVDEDDKYTWEVKEVNPHNFEKVFGYEPAFEKGDQQRREITEIRESGDDWTFTIEFWDYKSDFDDNGTVIYKNIPGDPADFDEDIFLPTPIDDYLEDAAEDLPSEYIVEGKKVTRRESDYTVEKEYDEKGVLFSETYTDDDGIVMVKIEGTFVSIPLGNDYIGFILLAVVSIIIVIIKKKKILIKQ